MVRDQAAVGELRRFMRSQTCILTTTLSCLIMTSTARAGIWFEVGDAGQNGIAAAQTPVGSGTLDGINGIISTGNDVDVYQILITDFANFDAYTTGPLDTMLWLFKADGTGQVANDDFPGLDTLQLSRLTNQGVFSNGVYFLAVSRFNNQPRDAGDNAIFGNTYYPGPPNTWQAQPISGSGPFDHWTGSTGASGGYLVTLTGVGYVPSPGSLGLLAISALVNRRRRR